MKPTRIWIAAFMVGLLAMSYHSSAGVDKEDAQITLAEWWGPSSGYSAEWYVDSATNKPDKWKDRKYLADTGLIAAHARQETGQNPELVHYHLRHEWGEEEASAAEANAYWDYRFQTGRSDMSQLTGAVRQHKTCWEWAFTTSGRTTGTYEYKLGSVALREVCDHDVDAVPDADVAKGDLLSYADHATYVEDVRDDGEGGKEPSKLRWKWKGSGTYEYETPNNGENEFDTPLCHNPAADSFEGDDEIDKTKEIDEQTWIWDLDGRTNATVFH